MTSKPKGADGKKPYGRPKLRKFGDVSELTQMIDNKGSADGGMGSTDKT